MDEKDYSDVFTSMKGVIVSYFLSNKVSFHDVEDLVNEVFMLVWKYRETLRDRNRLKGWIFAIAKNVLKRYKNYSKSKSIGLDYDIVEQKDKNDDETLKFVLEIIEKLPKSYKDVFVLFYVGQKSLKEISEILGISESNCKVRLFRARKKLRKLISDGKTF